MQQWFTRILLAGALVSGVAFASGKQLGNGMACTYSSDCISGNCSSGSCKSNGGGKQLGNGMACTYSSDCITGNCSSGKCKAN